MNHLFRAKRMGYEEKRDGIYFDANLYSLEEAIAQFKPFQGISQKGYPYTGYEYKGVKYHDFQYLGLFPKKAMPRDDNEYLDALLKRNRRHQ